MRDPGLLPGDPIDVAVADGAGRERCKVGAGVGLGEHGRGQDLARSDSRQPFLLLRVGAAVQDQLLGDLGARAERADADITARELLGDHAHRLLAEAEPAIFLRQREREHAKLAHLGNQRQRHIVVLQVPVLRVRNDLGFGEAAHLVADGLERLVEPGIAVGGGALAVLDQRDDAGARLGRCRRNQGADGRREERRLVAVVDAELVQPRGLALAHGHAARELGEIFGSADLREQALHLAEPALAIEARRIVGKLVQRFDIGGEPGEAVGRMLLALERLGIDLAVRDDLRGDALDGAIAQRRGGLGGLGKEGNKLGPSPRLPASHGFGDSHDPAPIVAALRVPKNTEACPASGVKSELGGAPV